MKLPWTYGLAVTGLAIALLFVGSFYAVTEGEAVVVVRLGRPARVVRSAGPAWKFPEPLERLHRIDLRRQLADTPSVTALTRDRKSIVLEAFVAWRVADPLLFLQATTGLEAAAETLAGMVSAAQNQELSRFELADLVTTDASAAENLERFEQRVRERVSPLVRDRLGIVVDRVGVRRVSLPIENLPAVLERMRADRETEADRSRRAHFREAGAADRDR